jgi:hypothetical protein
VHLKGLTNLEWLFLSDTQITPEGVNKLKKTLPDCRIDYSAQRLSTDWPNGGSSNLIWKAPSNGVE